MPDGRKLTGVERDRTVIRSAALRIIREIVEIPAFDKMKKNEIRKGVLAPPPLSVFQHLEPLGFGLSDDDWWIFNPDDCPPDLVWPMSVGLICDKSNSDPAMKFSIGRFITVSPKQLRGSVHRFGPFMVRHDYAQVDQDQLVTAVGIYVWLGGRWTDAAKEIQWTDKGLPIGNRELARQDRQQPALATAIALRQRYEWAVSLGLEESPSIRFATDPTGIKDVFRIRDLPEGRDRREALMHWVTDHWRQDRVDPDMEIYVRHHLRGAARFSWRGMECHLLPSRFDLDQRDRLMAERDAMRVAGTDVRTRPQLR